MTSARYWAVLLADDDEIQIKDPAAGMRVIHRIPVGQYQKIHANRSALALVGAGYVMVGKFCGHPDGSATVIVKRSR